jgi:DNA mismatch endonuclease, patch repair protein
LPGTPDLIFPKLRIALFVHGCFWHRHPGCKKASSPKSSVNFWNQKFARNMARDRENQEALSAQGWRTEVIWECETKVPQTLTDQLDLIFGTQATRAA